MGFLNTLKGINTLKSINTLKGAGECDGTGSNRIVRSCPQLGNGALEDVGSLLGGIGISVNVQVHDEIVEGFYQVGFF